MTAFPRSMAVVEVVVAVQNRFVYEYAYAVNSVANFVLTDGAQACYQAKPSKKK